ncbi:hypothetical protein [Aquisediminimonas sediminicola]|uniref:hypothetical protein n=1 Tax=Alteraquisediminimonas sediminicola TaxID=2676787 RepID=UPI001FE2860E|nr:hypothetical protein [Aquisediminimonas sediminicola]
MNHKNIQPSSVEPFPVQTRSSFVTDELSKITSTLREVCPVDAAISLHFDGKLHLHIDVRNMESVMGIEAMLPTLGAGLFHDIQRGPTPHQPFFHRVSAIVDR